MGILESGEVSICFLQVEEANRGKLFWFLDFISRVIVKEIQPSISRICTPLYAIF